MTIDACQVCGLPSLPRASAETRALAEASGEPLCACGQIAGPAPRTPQKRAGSSQDTSPRPVMIHADGAAVKAGRPPVSFTLPLPPTTGRLWQSVIIGGKTRRVLTRAARDWKSDTQKALPVAFFEGAVRLTVHVYQPRRGCDVENRVKALSDAMTHYIWHDDSQITEMHLYNHIDRQNPRVEVEVADGPTEGGAE